MDDEVRFILPYTIYGMSNELHLVLQGPACSTMFVDDTNNFVDTHDFVFVFDDLLPSNLKTYKPKSVVISNFKSLFRRSNSYTIPIFDLVVRKAVFAEIASLWQGPLLECVFFFCLGKQSSGPFHMTMQDFICRVNPPEFNPFT